KKTAQPDLPEQHEQREQSAPPVQQPVHTDYRKQFDDLIAQSGKKEPAAEPITSQVIPKQMPPFVMPSAQQEKPQTMPEKPAFAAEQSGQETVKKEDVQLEAAMIDQQIAQEPQKPEYQFPPVSLLHGGGGTMADGTNEMRQNAERLNDTLKSFGIEAHIVNVTRGPSITRYELELSSGTKLSKVTNLADDFALALGASGVRIAAIPEKISVVGIEVPNRLVSTVFARDVIDSNEFNKSKSRISFAVGKDIGGSCIIGDIGKLPHMLIAGTTGSGKSVCMNSLIISLLYKAKPEDVRLIMVDPKMVELGIYNGIPHLLIPVVTDPKKAAGALQWGVTEMMRRYRLMADAGVRDLEAFNKLAENSEEFEHMAQIVVVIDELADLMLVAAKEVEESICRIAQMGRAAGIHLVIATQRPSADVITGLMKANIPSRIAFAVASAMESRIILDTAGAEKLVGKGDMLYAPLGQGKPKRVQGCFITDDEVSDVVNFVKKFSTPDYSEEVLQEIDRKASESGKTSSGGSVSVSEPSSDGDEMLPAAVDVILETGQASVSMLQRRLKLGYARAARIMDEMEDKGIVGPFEGSKPRQLLITKDQWEILKNGGSLTDNPPVEEEIP
ncbi:MAG: DNA translocase FtsK, partial [Clostridia bacterium]|nr:DNA translocase FtsK [Clostridia bacterium]